MSRSPSFSRQDRRETSESAKRETVRKLYSKSEFAKRETGRKLFLFDLAPSLTEKQLRALCEPYGTTDSFAISD